MEDNCFFTISPQKEKKHFSRNDRKYIVTFYSQEISKLYEEPIRNVTLKTLIIIEYLLKYHTYIEDLSNYRNYNKDLSNYCT